VNDKHRNLPPPDRTEPVVTYSRIGSRIVDEANVSHDERVTPMLDAVEMDPPRASDRDSGTLGGQTLEDRLTGSGGGGRSLRFVMLAGVAAVVVGVGVLAVTFNSARQAPTAATASNSAPAKVTDVSRDAIDITPAATSREGETEQALAPVSESRDPEAKAAPLPADEAAATTNGKADGSSASDVAAIDPVQAEPAAPPIPRARPKVEEPVAVNAKPQPAASESVKPTTAPAEQAKVAPRPEPDDGMFVEEVERRLATAPRVREPTNEMSSPVMAPPELLPGADIAGERATVPVANSTPERLVPPADIPNAGSYDQAYGTGDLYEPQGGSNGYDYGQPLEEGGWDPEASAVPAPQWVVLGVRQGRAIVDGRQYGVFMVGPGSEIPGVGTVEAIEWRGNGWVVITSNGAVLTSLADSDQRY
jgi:hypothetical protein